MPPEKFSEWERKWEQIRWCPIFSAGASNGTATRLANHFETAANRDNLRKASPENELRLAADDLNKAAYGFKLAEALKGGGHRRFLRLAMRTARDRFSLELELN